MPKKETKKKDKKADKLTEIPLPNINDLKSIQEHQPPVKTNANLSKSKSYQLLAANKHLKIVILKLIELKFKD